MAGAIGDRSVAGILLGANMVFAGILLLVWLGIGKNTLAIYGACCGYFTGVIVFALLAWRSSDFYHYFAGERVSDFWSMFVLYAWIGTYFGTLLGFLCPKESGFKPK